MDGSAIQTVFQTALESISGDVLGLVGVALPVALGIVGTFTAVKLGVKFFKSVTN